VTFYYQKRSLTVWERSPKLGQNIAPPPRLLISKALFALFWSWSWRFSDDTSGGNPVTRLNKPVIIPRPKAGAKTCRCNRFYRERKVEHFLSNRITRGPKHSTTRISCYLANQISHLTHQVFIGYRLRKPEAGASICTKLPGEWLRPHYWNNLPGLPTQWVIHDLDGTVTRWSIIIINTLLVH